MTAAFQFLLLVGCVARSRSSDFQARIRASLEESLARYPAVENSTEDAARHMKSLLFEKKYSVLVYEGRIIVDRRFLEGGKNAKHVNVVASMLARGSLPNAAYFFSGESTGWCDVDKVGRPAVSPCLVIAKVAGHGMRGVLAPNPYFEDVGSWESVRRSIRSWSERRPFDARRPRVFWRGHIGDSWHDPAGPGWRDVEPCQHESGNHARLAAAAATLERPDVVDVKCWSLDKCAPRDDRAEACAFLPYTATMARVRDDPAIVTDHRGHVARENFTRWKYVLNLPGSTAGSYSRNLNHLWAVGSVVFFWAAPFVEWYFPALDAGATHVVVDAKNLSSTVDALEAGALNATALVERAARVDAELLCPDCLGDYTRTVFDALRSRFKLGAVLDDPCVAELFFEHLNCTGLHLYEVHRARPDDDRTKDGGRALAAERLPARGCKTLVQRARARCVATGGSNATRARRRFVHRRSIVDGLTKKRTKARPRGPGA